MANNPYFGSYTVGGNAPQRAGAISAVLEEYAQTAATRQAATVPADLYGIDKLSGKLILNGYLADPNNADSIMGAAKAAREDIANGIVRPLQPMHGLEIVPEDYMNQWVSAATVPDASIGDYAKGFVAPIVGGVGSLLQTNPLTAGVGKALRSGEEAIRRSMTLAGQAASRPPITGNILKGDVEFDPNANASTWGMQAANVGSIFVPAGAAVGTARLAGAGLRAFGIAEKAATTGAKIAGAVAGGGTGAVMEAVPEYEAVKAHYEGMTNEEIYASDPEFARQVDALKRDTGESADNPTAMQRLREAYIENQATSGAFGAGFGGAVQTTSMGLFQGVRGIVGRAAAGGNTAAQQAQKLALGKLNPERAIASIESGTGRRLATAGYAGTIEGAAEASEPAFSNLMQAMGSGRPITAEEIGAGTAEQFTAGAVMGGIVGGGTSTPRREPPPAPPPVGENQPSLEPPPPTTSLPPPPPPAAGGNWMDQFVGPMPEAAGPQQGTVGQEAVAVASTIDREIGQRSQTMQAQLSDLNEQRERILEVATNATPQELAPLEAQLVDLDVQIDQLSMQLQGLESEARQQKAAAIKDVSKRRGVRSAEVLREAKVLDQKQQEARNAIATARGEAAPATTALQEGQDALEAAIRAHNTQVESTLLPALQQAQKALEQAEKRAARTREGSEARRRAVAEVYAAQVALQEAQRKFDGSQQDALSAVNAALNSVATKHGLDPIAFSDSLSRYSKELDRIEARTIRNSAARAKQLEKRRAEREKRSRVQQALALKEGESVPERPQDIDAQLEASKQTGKVVFADEGATKAQSPTGFTTVKSKFGGEYYVPTKPGYRSVVSRIKAQEKAAESGTVTVNEARSNILNYTQTKEQAMKGKPVAVTARTKGGAVASAELVDANKPEAVAKAKRTAAKAAAATGGKVATETPEKIVAERARQPAPRKTTGVKAAAIKRKAAAKKATSKTKAVRKAPAKRRAAPKKKAQAAKSTSKKKKGEGVLIAGVRKPAPMVPFRATRPAVVEAPPTEGLMNPVLRESLRRAAHFPIHTAPESTDAPSVIAWLNHLQESAVAVGSIGGDVDGLVPYVDLETSEVTPSLFMRWQKLVRENWRIMSQQEQMDILDRFGSTANRLVLMRRAQLRKRAANIQKQEKHQASTKFSKAKLQMKRAAGAVREALYKSKYGPYIRALERQGRVVIGPGAATNAAKDNEGRVMLTAADLARLDSENATLRTFADTFANVQLYGQGVIKRETRTQQDAQTVAKALVNVMFYDNWAFMSRVDVDKLNLSRMFLLPNGEQVDPHNIAEMMQLSLLSQELVMAREDGTLDKKKEEMASSAEQEREAAFHRLSNNVARAMLKASAPEGVKPVNEMEAALLLFHLSKRSYGMDAEGKSVAREINDRNTLIPTVLKVAQIYDIVQNIRAGSTVREAFNKALSSYWQSIKQRLQQESANGWVTFPQSSDPEDAQFLQDACTGTQWCVTQNNFSESYLENNTMMVYFRDGDPRLLAALEDTTKGGVPSINVREGPNGRGPGQTVLPQDHDIAMEFLMETNPELFGLMTDVRTALEQKVVSKKLARALSKVSVMALEKKGKEELKFQISTASHSDALDRVMRKMFYNYELRGKAKMAIKDIMDEITLDDLMETAPDGTVTSHVPMVINAFSPEISGRAVEDLIHNLRSAPELAVVVHGLGDTNAWHGSGNFTETVITLANLEQVDNLEVRPGMSSVKGDVYVDLPKLKVARNVEVNRDLYTEGKRINTYVNAPELTNANIFSISGIDVRVDAPSLVKAFTVGVTGKTPIANFPSLETVDSLNYEAAESGNAEFPALREATYVVANNAEVSLPSFVDGNLHPYDEANFYAPQLAITPDEINMYHYRGNGAGFAGSITGINSNGEELILIFDSGGRDGYAFSTTDPSGTTLYSMDEGVPVGATVTDDNGNTTVYINEESITPENAEAVLLHESFHAFVREAIGEKAWNTLMERLGQIYESARQGEGNPFFARALARIPDTTNPDHVVEEMGAYAVEEYERTGGEGMLASIVKWVRDLLAAVRTAFARFGILPKNLTEADLAALAKRALRTAALRRHTGVPSGANASLKYSIGSDGFSERAEDGTSGSRNGPAGLINTAATFANTVGAAARRASPTMMTNVRHLTAKGLRRILPLITPHQMADWVGASDLVTESQQKFYSALLGFTRLFDKRKALYMHFVSKAASLDTAYRSLEQDTKDKWNNVAYRATVWRIHPDLPWEDEANRHNHGNPYMKEAYEQLKAEYESMPRIARELYQNTRNLQTELWENIKSKAGVTDSTVGPFFHLTRHGDYVVDAKRDFVMTAPNEEAIRDEIHKLYASDPARYKFTEAEPDPNGGWSVGVTDRTFAFAPNLRDAESMKADLARDYGEENVSVRLKAESVVEQGMISKELYNKMVKSITDEVSDPTEREAALQGLLDTYIRFLPESNSARILSHRHNVKGADLDMWFAAREYFNSGSMLNATLQYKDAIRDELDAMKTSVNQMISNREPSDTFQSITTELEKYVKSDTLAQRSRVAAMLNEAMFVIYLSSPSYWLVNLTQVPMFTIPYLKRTFNDEGQSVSKELKDAYKQTIPVIKTLVKREFWLTFGKALREEDRAHMSIKEVVLEDLKAAGSINDDEQAMLDKLFDLARIDISFAHNTIQVLGPDPTSMIGKGYRTAVNAVSIMPHYTETLNRLVTALAAYRMAVKAGHTPAESTEMANVAVRKTQFDYANRPRLFNNPAMQVVLQFKIYAQHVANMWAEIAHDLATNPADSDEFKAAMRHMKWAIGTAVMGAGVTGLPMVIFLPLLAAAGLMGGDEDDDLDANGKVEKLVRDLLGDEVGKAVAYGPLFNALGIDMSNRLAQNGLLFNSDFIHADDARGTALESIAQLLGPAAGYVLNVADATDMLMQGNVLRATEMAMPKATKDLLRAFRLGSEGISTRSGRELLPSDELTLADLLLTGIGVMPSDVSTYQRERSRLYDVQDMYRDTRKALLTEFYNARTAEEKAMVMEDIDAFNARIPDSDAAFKITGKSLAESGKQRRAREQQIQQQGGLDIDPKRKWLAQRALASPAY